MYFLKKLLRDQTCCHGYSYDSVKLHKIPNNVSHIRDSQDPQRFENL